MILRGIEIFEVIMIPKDDKFEKASPKPLKNAPPPPLPFAHHIKEGKKVAKEKHKDAESDDESMQMIQHMKEMHDEIDRMINELLEKTGWTPKYLELYLRNPNNFSASDWENLQAQRKELMDSIKTPKDLREEEERAKKGPIKRDNTAHDPQIAKERRSKTVGARRNWLPMR
jgi:hypothetical protein